MRVAMVSEHASPLAVLGGVDAGGQNVHVASLSTKLAELGAEVVVHTRRDRTDLPRRVELAPGVVVDHVDAGPPTPLPKDQLLPHMAQFAAHLGRAWAEERPHVVHAHFWMSGVASLDAAAPLGLPVFQTFHALGVVKRRQQGDKDTSPPERVLAESLIARRAARIIATSRGEVDELVDMGAPEAAISVVPCGVDLSFFGIRGKVERRDERLRRLVVVSRLVERKGIGNVIAALASVPGTELVVAGGPPRSRLDDDPEVARLRRVAVEHGVADRVLWRGQVSRAALPPLLRSADAVVCVPWYEPFGIVPLEAMACGVPVVATEVGGLRETVVDGVTGVHVPPRRPDALSAALRALLDDPATCAQMGRAGAERARSRYAWDACASATLDLYGSARERTSELVSGALR